MDISISEMMRMQQELYALHQDQWAPREPEFGKEHILYMIEEIGETIAILKKKGSGEVLTDTDVRIAFLEEMADILMYYTDVLLCFHVTPEEISEAFKNKFRHNMERNYTQEYKELYHNG